MTVKIFFSTTAIISGLVAVIIQILFFEKILLPEIDGFLVFFQCIMMVIFLSFLYAIVINIDFINGNFKKLKLISYILFFLYCLSIFFLVFKLGFSNFYLPLCFFVLFILNFSVQGLLKKTNLKFEYENITQQIYLLIAFISLPILLLLLFSLAQHFS